MTPYEIAGNAVKALDAKKAVHLRMIRIKNITVLADYFVIATGTSTTQVRALSDETEVKLGELGTLPIHKEGYGSNSWVLLDYGSVVVHVFTPEARAFYDLDRLWRDGEECDFSEFLK